MNRIKTSLLFVAVVLFSAFSTVANADGVPPTFKDLSYGSHERDVMNVWLAESDSLTPVIIHIHPGGFRSGEKMEDGGGDVKQSLAAGVSFVSIEYPFYDDVPLLEIIRDHIARSVQFVRYKSGEWNIDPARVAVYGSSAGAGSSLWIAFHDDIANPESTDPVLRESSRVVAAGAIHTQATYDIVRWPEVLRMSRAEFEKLNSSLFPRCLEMYHLDTEQQLYEEPGLTIRRELDMLGMMDPGDPPIYIKADRQPSVFDLLHHPNHAKTVKKHAAEKGVNATVFFKSTPEEERIGAIDFLLKYLQ